MRCALQDQLHCSLPLTTQQRSTNPARQQSVIHITPSILVRVNQSACMKRPRQRSATQSTAGL
jgi:hypothetical protein